jgi:raffinose/stachyose/melibiose transport system substrate-binding protein
MNKVIKSLSLLLVFGLILSSVLTGCGSTPAQSTKDNNTTTDKAKVDEKDTSAKSADISLAMSVNEESIKNEINAIAGDFEKQNPGVKISLSFPGQEYENVMKIKMSANELPDLFDTHGWAILRYGKYLTDLSKEKWAPNITDTIKNVIMDKDGKVYCLVLAEAKDGIIYNEDVLKQYNIEIPTTMDQFIAACEKIKKDSGGKVAPIYFAGVDSWTVGAFFDIFATPLLISPKDNSASELLDGTFDWSKWTPLVKVFQDINNKGLVNEDILTAKYSDLGKKLAEGKVAFAVMGLGVAGDAKAVNPDVKIGIMPVPAMVAGDVPSFSGGERYTLGVWKDSKNMDVAKKLVDFYSQSDNMSGIANASKLPSGLS